MLESLYNDYIWSARHCGRERDSFSLRRENGLPMYTFWHFFNSVDLLTPNGLIVTEPNACYICPPNVKQYFVSHGPLCHDWLHFDAKTAKAAESYGIETERLYYPNKPNSITDIIAKIEQETFTPNSYYEDYIDLKLSELFIILSRDCNENKSALNAGTRELFKEIRVKMLTHPEREWTVEELARQALMSSSNFHLIYKRLFGASPMRDLTDIRISGAKYHLINTDFPVKYIAQKAGYGNQYHFSKQFKAAVGVSPTEFRKQNKA